MDLARLRKYDMILCDSCNDLVAHWSKRVKIYDHSHTLAKSRFPLLEDDPDNISIRCRDCHQALDNRAFEKIGGFRDLDKIMEYMKRMAPGEYNMFVLRLEQIGVNEYKTIEL
jgi:hypothetical protein